MNPLRKTDLKNLTQEGLIDYTESLGQPAFRGKQIMGWLYRPGITEFSQMTDLAKSFRKMLEEHATYPYFRILLLKKPAMAASNLALDSVMGISLNQF